MEEKLSRSEQLSFNYKRIYELLEPQLNVTIKRINVITEINKPTCLQIEYMDDTFKHITEDKIQKYVTELEINNKK